ncbi:uncharacterized protein LOC129580222 [Sitodiplosis mosellana]|uniref:uncharacterized protein LOC129580215 n=1 Tax=Sitodiplosis mosellana TaxID=263140 RepID=UPI0024451069|nr:uncharacterized protein LOC129580215 [Sitodiplosis mosellana]XP_055326407.1 uncharacterized protein LOC129580215 [Sitodiplosis mosellana]XP_055326419.1 uncharacterized protein LOC129580222 [Sitodiplosis mosellana]XP_055326420.1 uncharacterized protein LOC129580222 [Sitodiplosis mosellana]
MEEYEAYIDQLPEKLLKTLEEADGHPASEEELREIYEAHKELKRNVEKLKQEMNDKVEKMQVISDKLKTDEDANALDLVTKLMQSCGIPCDEGINELLANDSHSSIIGNEINELKESSKTEKSIAAAESIENDETEECTDWEDGAYGIDFKQIEKLREIHISPEANRFKLTTRSLPRSYDLEDTSSFNVHK